MISLYQSFGQLNAINDTDDTTLTVSVIVPVLIVNMEIPPESLETRAVYLETLDHLGVSGGERDQSALSINSVHSAESPPSLWSTTIPYGGIPAYRSSHRNQCKHCKQKEIRMPRPPGRTDMVPHTPRVEKTDVAHTPRVENTDIVTYTPRVVRTDLVAHTLRAEKTDIVAHTPRVENSDLVAHTPRVGRTDLVEYIPRPVNNSETACNGKSDTVPCSLRSGEIDPVIACNKVTTDTIAFTLRPTVTDVVEYDRPKKTDSMTTFKKVGTTDTAHSRRNVPMKCERNCGHTRKCTKCCGKPGQSDSKQWADRGDNEANTQLGQSYPSRQWVNRDETDINQSNSHLKQSEKRNGKSRILVPHTRQLRDDHQLPLQTPGGDSCEYKQNGGCQGDDQYRQTQRDVSCKMVGGNLEPCQSQNVCQHYREQTCQNQQDISQHLPLDTFCQSLRRPIYRAENQNGSIQQIPQPFQVAREKRDSNPISCQLEQQTLPENHEQPRMFCQYIEQIKHPQQRQPQKHHLEENEQSVQFKGSGTRSERSLTSRGTQESHLKGKKTHQAWGCRRTPHLIRKPGGPTSMQKCSNQQTAFQKWPKTPLQESHLVPLPGCSTQHTPSQGSNQHPPSQGCSNQHTPSQGYSNGIPSRESRTPFQCGSTQAQFEGQIPGFFQDSYLTPLAGCSAQQTLLQDCPIRIPFSTRKRKRRAEILQGGADELQEMEVAAAAVPDEQMGEDSDQRRRRRNKSRNKPGGKKSKRQNCVIM
ncbi:hypothetical protein WDU94_002780 [Cyamophila willieti]